MRNVLNNRIIAICLFLLCGITQGHAQILDWIGDQLKGYVDRKINSIVGYTDSQLGSFGSALWDGIVESKLQGDLSDEMQKFDDFEVSEAGLNNVNSKYGLSGDQNDFRKIYWNQSDLTKSYIFSKRNVALAFLGNGAVQTSATAFMDNVSMSTRIDELSDVLNRNVIDSIGIFTQQSPSFAYVLLTNIQKDNRIAYILNNHPTAVRICYNASGVASIAQSPAMLLYLAGQADSYYSILPKKNGLPLMRDLNFSNNGRLAVVSYKNTELAEIDGSRTVICKTLDMLNMRGMPNATYVCGNTQWVTDALGRVIKVQQSINTNAKGKCPLKSKVKSKKFAPILSNSYANMMYTLGDTKCGAPDVLRNTVYVAKSDSNKQMLKLIKKMEKSISKESSTYTKTTELEYHDGSLIPGTVTVSFDNSYGTYTLKNM